MDDEKAIQEYLLALGKRTRELRKQHNLTQLDLSASSGLDVRHIQRLEVGQANLSIASAWKIAEQFKMELTDYLNLASASM